MHPSSDRQEEDRAWEIEHIHPVAKAAVRVEVNRVGNLVLLGGP